jgi:hypothetical protein
MTEHEVIALEATVTPGNEPTGKEWEVTIIGAKSPKDLLTIDGRHYVVSENGRLYDVAALADSVSQWDGVKVYDNHLTQEEFERKQGMRSPATEWLGTIVKPRWDAKKAQLRGVFKVIVPALAEKLRAAYDEGILSTIGLSIDTFPELGADVFYEGDRLPVIKGFKMIRSVDLVAEPAAGGQFERLIAAHIDKETDMSEETQDVVIPDNIKDIVSAAVADALAAKEAEEEPNYDDMPDEEVVKAKADKETAEAKLEAKRAAQEAEKAKREAALARTMLTIEHRLEKAKLPEKFEEAIRLQFKDRIVGAEEIDQAIKSLKEAQASLDPSGRVRAGGGDVTIGVVPDDRLELEVARLLMGNTEFKALEHSEDDIVKERIAESSAYDSWIKAGKPDLPKYQRISSLLYDYFGGDPLFNNRAMEAATTSTLTTAVKNTVNIMTANMYSQRELWFEPIVQTHEVDTIDDATLARLTGTNALSTVNEGAAYTELAIADAEETASFVKRGNYIGITLEVLMSDKIGFVRRIPQVLANSWYNTQSDLVSNVFTVNTAAGPVLADSGALFNATALSSAGGHANLLTTGLSHAEFSVVRTAMAKQTDQVLGAGRRLLLRPRYLLVPADLEVTALNIRNSELVPGESGGATTGGQLQTVNNFRGTFDVIVVPTWTDTDNWAAVADPAVAPAIHLIYPRGQRTPQVFSADGETSGAMFTNDEIRLKVRLMTYRFSSTYDCAPVSDWRGLHKSNV